MVVPRRSLLSVRRLQVPGWLLEVGLGAATLVVLVIWRTWPLAARLWTHIWGIERFAIVHPDPYLTVWIVNWAARALTTAPWEYPNAPIFYPAQTAVGYTEHMLGLLPVTLPAYLATGDPVFTHQLLLLATFLVSALTMAALVGYWTRSMAGAVVAGALFAFAPWRFHSAQQVHLLSTLYAPLVLLFSSRYLLRGGIGNLAGAAATLLGQALCSYSLAYPIYAGTGAFWLVHTLALRAPVRRLGMLLVAAALSGAVLVIASVPQFTVQNLGVSDIHPLWNPGTMLRGSGIPLSAWFDSHTGFFAGYECYGLALAGVVFAVFGVGDQRWRIGGRVLVASLLAFALPLVVLSLGPHSEIGGDLLAWLWERVPGLAYYRTASRFGFLVWLPLAALGGAALAVLEQSVRTRSWLPRLALWAVVGAALVAFGWRQHRQNLGIALVPVRPLPDAYAWLREHGTGSGAVLEIPAGVVGRRGLRYDDAVYTFWSTYHHQPLVNGYGGYAPRTYPLVLNLAAQLPSTEALQTLQRLTGLRWLIVHLSELLPAERERWEGAHDLAPVARFGDDLVFAVEGTGESLEDQYQRPRTSTTLTGTPLAPIQGKARISWSDSRRAEAGQGIPVTVTVQNVGTDPWPSLTSDPTRRVSVVFRWKDRESVGEHAGAPQPRALLLGWETMSRLQPPPVAAVIPRDLAPGERAVVSAVIAAPSTPGTYDLVAEVVQGEVDVFTNVEPTAARRIEVH